MGTHLLGRPLPRGGPSGDQDGVGGSQLPEPPAFALLTSARSAFVVGGARQEAAEVAVPVHAGPARLWRGEGRAGVAQGVWVPRGL